MVHVLARTPRGGQAGLVFQAGRPGRTPSGPVAGTHTERMVEVAEALAEVRKARRVVAAARIQQVVAEGRP